MENSSSQSIYTKNKDKSNISAFLNHPISPQVENQESSFRIRHGSTKIKLSKHENRETERTETPIQTKRMGTPVQSNEIIIIKKNNKVSINPRISIEVYTEIIETLSYQIIKSKFVDKEFVCKILEFAEKNESLKKIKPFMELTKIDEENYSVNHKESCIININSNTHLIKKINKKTGKTRKTRKTISACEKNEKNANSKFLMKDSNELSKHDANTSVLKKEFQANFAYIQPDTPSEEKVKTNSDHEENYSENTSNIKIISEDAQVKSDSYKNEENIEKDNKKSTISTLRENPTVSPSPLENSIDEIRIIKKPSYEEEKKNPQETSSLKKSTLSQGTRPPPLNLFKNKPSDNLKDSLNNTESLSPQLTPIPKVEEFTKTQSSFYADHQELQNFNKENKEILPSNKIYLDNSKAKPTENNFLTSSNPYNPTKIIFETIPDPKNPFVSTGKTNSNNSEFTLGFCDKNSSGNTLQSELNMIQNTPRYNTLPEENSSDIKNQHNEIPVPIIDSKFPMPVLPPPPMIPASFPVSVQMIPPPLFPLPIQPISTPVQMTPPPLFPLPIKPISTPVQMTPPTLSSLPKDPKFNNEDLPLKNPSLIPSARPINILNQPLLTPEIVLAKYLNPPSLINYSNIPSQYENSDLLYKPNFPICKNTNNFIQPISNIEPPVYNPNAQPNLHTKTNPVLPLSPQIQSSNAYVNQISQVPQIKKTSSNQYEYENLIMPEPYNTPKNDYKFCPPSPFLNQNLSSNNDKEAHFAPFPNYFPQAKIQQPQPPYLPHLSRENPPQINNHYPQSPIPKINQNTPLIPNPTSHMISDKPQAYYNYANPPYPEPNYAYFTVENENKKENDLKIRQNLASSQKNKRFKLCIICNELKERETFEVVKCEEKYGNCQVCSFCRKKMKEYCVACNRKYTEYDKDSLDIE
ncbi:hypothetical protein SteCoe_37779 [Stentor coeruleus]|uniref:Uncharacterized protein n=1 Tax=Stentor coeruleus TaxID=5963 RepID=A0A1R2AMF3_9CILI|nr:hypothetical protein SteCoe_37779 [Stentor coeruleus]